MLINKHSGMKILLSVALLLFTWLSIEAQPNTIPGSYTNIKYDEGDRRSMTFRARSLSSLPFSFSITTMLLTRSLMVSRALL